MKEPKKLEKKKILNFCLQVLNAAWTPHKMPELERGAQASKW